jgi:hypothetical protein
VLENFKKMLKGRISYILNNFNFKGFAWCSASCPASFTGSNTHGSMLDKIQLIETIQKCNLLGTSREVLS